MRGKNETPRGGPVPGDRHPGLPAGLDRDQFLAKVLDETGVFLEVIDPLEEARLAISGCVPLLNGRDDHALIFDIGGGSTQVVLLDAKPDMPEIIDSLSIPFGVVTLGEQVGSGMLDDAAYGGWVAMVAAEFAEFCQANI